MDNVNPAFYTGLGLLNQYLKPRFSAKMRLLTFQIRMLRDLINAAKIVPTPKERAELMRLGEIGALF